MRWDKVKIKDFTTVLTGGTPSTSVPEYWDDGNIPWLNSGELNQGIINSCSNFITKSGLENSSARMFPKDTVLIALTGATTGVTGYLTFEACGNQSVTGILPSNNHNSKYLYYFLSSIRSKVLNDAYGGAQKHISQQYVKELSVPLPPLHIQEQIADTLDKADALRKKDQLLLQKYDELAQATFYDMFGELFSNKFNWNIKELKDIVDPQTVVTYGIVQAGPHLEYGVPYIKTGDIKNGKINDNLSRTSEKIASSFKRSEVKEGDIVISIRATVGTVAVVPKHLTGANLTQGTAKISPGIMVTTEFLYYYLKSNSAQEWIKRQVKGATFREITLEKLRKMPVFVPNIDRQIGFSNSIKNISIQYEKCSQVIRESDQLFNLLQERIK